MKMKVVLVEGLLGDKETYAFRTLFHLCGYPVIFGKQEINDKRKIKIRYSPDLDSPGENILHIKKELSFWKNGYKPKFKKIENLPVPVCLHDKRLTLFRNNHINYDLPFIFWYFLSGLVEPYDTPRDSHGRPLPDVCFLGLNGLHDFPLLNRYVNFFKKILEQQYRLEPGVSLYPEGKTYAVGLSHDVDHCGTSWKQNVWQHYIMTRKNPLDLRRVILRSLNLLFSPDYSNNYDAIMNFEEKYSVRSTFFLGQNLTMMVFLYLMIFLVPWCKKLSVKWLKEDGRSVCTLVTMHGMMRIHLNYRKRYLKKNLEKRCLD